jgi:outer membrane protein assembly factor BamB
VPSRRQLLAGGVVAAGGVVGGYAGKWPISLDGEAKWPMARHDPAGTGATDQAGPKSEPELLWQSEGRFDRQKSPVLIGDTLVASSDRSVVALDPETGEQRYERGGSYRMSPVVAQADTYRSDVVVTGNERGFVGLAASGGFALGGLAVGNERWQTTAKQSTRWQFTAASRASAVAANGTVYATVPNTNRVVAIDANSGRIEW